MKTPRKKIKKVIGLALEENRLSKGEIHSLFIHIRELIESNNLQNTFPLANFYCNWLVHTKMEKRNPIYRILESATDILVEYWVETKEEMVLKISELLSVSELRRELIKLFQQHDIETFLFDDIRNWNSVYSTIIENLADKPIQYPQDVKLNGKSEADCHYTNAYNKAKGNDRQIVRKLWLTEDGEEGVRNVHWNLGTANNVVIRGRFLKTEK